MELAEKVATIDRSDYRKALSELLKILFNEDKELSSMEQAVAELFDIREKSKKRHENLKNHPDKEKEIIEQYHTEYEKVLKLLKEHCEAYSFLKKQMMILNTKYRICLESGKSQFYETFKSGYPLVLLAFIANAQLREITGYDTMRLYEDIIGYLSSTTAVSITKYKLDNKEKHSAIMIKDYGQLDKFRIDYHDKAVGRFYHENLYSKGYDASIDMPSCFCCREYYLPLRGITIPHIKKINGKWNSSWKNIEPCGKRFMIISIKKGNKLRNAGRIDEELTAEDINGKFIFTNGIDYKDEWDERDSTSLHIIQGISLNNIFLKCDRLIYMEV